MSTLHDRIRAVVEQRLRIAREAAGPTRWEAESDDMGHFDVFTFDADGDMCEVANRIYKTDAEFIAANDPADAILGAEHALSVLERHQPANGMAEPDPAGDYCDYCSNLTQIGHPYPCVEIVALATRWRVEVDG